MSCSERNLRAPRDSVSFTFYTFYIYIYANGISIQSLGQLHFSSSASPAITCEFDIWATCTFTKFTVKSLPIQRAGRNPAKESEQSESISDS